ncbi:EF-hand domain-containing member C2 [Entophlyctis sp. JEL0112]|nr:EF-hand domain-containing member C2 [Entophlyctis sp. JEL0112]
MRIRAVLRFYAYFQEAVNESREEHYRIRRCNIYFYLEDDTIHVSEPKYANSGIPQGTLVRRHRIQNPASKKGQHYTVLDLNVDKEVTLYSKTFKIVGCDEFTRQFLQSLNVEVPAATAFPLDPYQTHRANLLARMNATRPSQTSHEPTATTLKKFLENDRRVLRFYCVWDDTNSVFGDARHMVVLYYLSDDTVEIHERIAANSGRERNTLFLRRGRLPRRRVRAQPGGGASAAASVDDGAAAHDDCFNERDFTIGAVLHLYGRPFVVCDCDEFTRAFYRERYGLDAFDPIRLEDYDEEDDALDAEAAKAVAEAHARESAAQLMIGADPAAPKDLKMMVRYDGVVLRFLAILKTDKQVDADRRFVISMYPADGSVSVFEPIQRNAGIRGGKFLEKAKIRKPDSGEYYEAKDFYIGDKRIF